LAGETILINEGIPGSGGLSASVHWAGDGELPEMSGRPTQMVRMTRSPFLLPGDSQFLFYFYFVLLFFVPIQAMLDDQSFKFMM
jgi:hypothetical protein